MGSQQFSDKSHAKIYNIYRPNIPEEIAKTIVSHLREKFHDPLEQAVDIGCGSGQSTIVLAPYFKRVFGIDESKVQICEANNSRVLNNIIFAVGPAETLPFVDNSVQLITACASLHWFKQECFFREVRRVLSNNGIFSAYTYHFVKPLTEDPKSSEKIDRLFEEKYKELHPYFSAEVFSSLNKYKDIYFPFEEVLRFPDFRQIFHGKLVDVIGYIESLSGFQTMKRKDAEKAQTYISDFSKMIIEILNLQKGKESHFLTLYRDFYIVLCRKCPQDY